MAWEDDDGNAIAPTTAAEGNPTKMSDHNANVAAIWCIQNTKGNSLPALSEVTYMPDPIHEAGGVFWALVEIKSGASAKIVNASLYDGITSNIFKNYGFLNRYVTVTGRAILVDTSPSGVDLTDYAPGGDKDNWWSGSNHNGGISVHSFTEYLPVFSVFMADSGANHENAERTVELGSPTVATLTLAIDAGTGDMTASFSHTGGADYYIIMLLEIKWTNKWPDASS